MLFDPGRNICLSPSWLRKPFHNFKKLAGSDTWLRFRKELRRAAGRRRFDREELIPIRFFLEILVSRVERATHSAISGQAGRSPLRFILTLYREFFPTRHRRASRVTPDATYRRMVG